VSFCLKVSLSASATNTVVAAREHRQGGQLEKLHQVALVNRPLGRARNLAAGSRLLQLPVSHVHIGRRALSYLAGPEQGVCECPLNFLKAFFFVSFPILWVPALPLLWLHKGILPRESNWESRSGRNLQLLEIL
jgi:hypothetical protein